MREVLRTVVLWGQYLLFCCLDIETERRFIIQLTEDIWKLRISFVRARDSYTITLAYNHTPWSINIYIYAETEEKRGRRLMMKHIWCKNSVLAWSLLLSWAPWLHNTSIFVAGGLIHSWDTMPTMCDNYPCPAFPAFRSNHQNHQRWGEGEGGGWKSILFIDANDDWEISTDARRSDFTQQKNKSPLSRQRRSN